MKKYILFIVFLIYVTGLFSQAPQKMSYQAVIRDASGNLVTNSAIGMQISILQGSITGTSVYVESQTPSSNTNGLVTIEIGSGNIVTGTFSAIDWAAGPYFIKTEVDPAGGANYTITGTTELLSVPYALLAEKAVKPTYPVSASVKSTTFAAQTARNMWVSDTGLVLTVPETGKYLLSFSASQYNNNQYFSYDTIYDTDGMVKVYNVTNSTDIVSANSLRAYYDLYTPSYSMRKEMPLIPSRTLIVDLIAGDELRLMYIQYAFGFPFPTYNWYIGNGNISILKIGD